MFTDVYADFLEETRITVKIVLPVHFRHRDPSDLSEYDKAYEEPEPRFYFNCFKREKLDFTTPLDLKTELAMRLVGPDLIKMEL